MIWNVVILVIANTIIPWLPITPEIFLAAPLSQLAFGQPSAFDHMNLSRIHTKQEFKKAFRESLKHLHPDRGGDPVAFSQVKNLKKIMEKEINYYDILNITEANLMQNQPFENVVAIKQTTYFVQSGIFYFVTILYALAFTIEDQLRPGRKLILPAILLFAIYQFFVFYHPEHPTPLDLIDGKIPIFIQRSIFRNLLSVLIAIVRTKIGRRKTDEKKILEQLHKQQPIQQYQIQLQALAQIYQKKAQQKQKAENSWGSRIKGWISTAFTLLVLYSVISGFFKSS